MASGDFTDLAEHACRSAQLDPTDTTDLTQAKAKVNEAYLSCLDSGDPWTFLQKEGQWVTVAGSDKYSYSSVVTGMSLTGATIRDIVKLVIDTDGFGSILQEMTWEDIEIRSASTKESGEGTGIPWAWARWGNQNAPNFRLYPSPDAVYTMGTFCYTSPSELSAGADLPLIPANYRHRVIVPYAAALLLEQEGGNEAGGQYERLMRRYEDAMKLMRISYATASDSTFNVVQPGFMEKMLGEYGRGW